METFRGKIRDLSSMGLGVVDHPEGRVFFVKGGWPGDEGLFQVESREKKYGFAKVLQLDTPSEDREPKACMHSGFDHGQCGGCSWMGIKYEKQLEQKQKMIEYLYGRNCTDQNAEIKTVWPSEKKFGYRNRAQLKTDGEHIGYVSPGTKTLAPISTCLVLTEPNQKTLADLQRQLPRKVWKPKPPYLWNFFDIDEEVTAKNVIANRKTTFKQANSEQNIRMQQWLLKKLSELDKNQKVLELFCGSGNFTEVISKAGFKKIVASELDQKAVANLAARKLSGVDAVSCDLFNPGRWASLFDVSSDAKILILDPPREGFKGIEKFIEGLPLLKHIFYISCEASRFFSESRLLQEAGWKLKEVQPVDQFPHTPHVELLAEFTRK